MIFISRVNNPDHKTYNNAVLGGYNSEEFREKCYNLAISEIFIKRDLYRMKNAK